MTRTHKSPFRTLRPQKQGLGTLGLALIWLVVRYVDPFHRTEWMWIVMGVLGICIFGNCGVLLVRCFQKRAHWWALIAALAMFIVGLVPTWSRLQGREELVSSLPQFRALAESVRAEPLKPIVTLNRDINGTTVQSGEHRGDAIFLVLSRHPDGEHGLIFSPTSRPAPPGWVKWETYTRLAPDCWEYRWRND